MTHDPQRLKFWSISLAVFCILTFAVSAGLIMVYYVKVYLPNKNELEFREEKELQERREFLLKVKMLEPDEIPIAEEKEHSHGPGGHTH